MRLTLADALERAAALRPARTALHVAGQRPVTYAELLATSREIASAITADDLEERRVAILLPNSTEWVAALFGCMLSRSTAVLLNTRLTVPELLYQVEQSDTRLLVTGPIHGRDREALIDVLRRERPGVPVVWAGGGAPAGARPWEDWLEAAARRRREIPTPLPPGPQDTAVVIYTSGTTALPKGVMLSHASLVRNAWVVGWHFGLTEDDRIFGAGPFCHSGGLTLHVLLAVLHAATACSMPHFDPDEALDMVENRRCTIYNGIETLFLRLLDARRFSPRRMASVRTGWATGSPAVLRKIADEVGVPGITSLYGISEASPNVSISRHDDSEEHRLETVGRPQPWTRVRIWDDDAGRPCGPGEAGEITVRGYNVMQGYYRKPEATAAALRDGWLHTGDLGILRADGYLRFAGRSKDIVRVGGENVSCLEVEDALYRLGGVDLAAVLPAGDQRYGEVPVAVIKPAAGADRDPDRILERLRSRLASYKLPRRIVFVDSMPLTESGKVQKRLLAERVLGAGGS